MWPVFNIFHDKPEILIYSLDLLISKNVDNKFKPIKIKHINGSEIHLGVRMACEPPVCDPSSFSLNQEDTLPEGILI